MMDLHSHTYFSDGTASPEEIVALAKEKEIKLCAVTDHDCIDGVRRACKHGAELNIAVLAGIEMDIACSKEMHLLGYGIDIHNEKLKEILQRQAKERKQRNAKIIEKLHSLGVNIDMEKADDLNIISKAHIAAALVEQGYCRDSKEAFEIYLGANGLARLDLERISSSEFFSLMQSMHAKTVLAHPGLIKGDVAEIEKLINHLMDDGLDGIEVYYPAHTLLQTVQFREIAERNHLMITTGSDYHGQMRKHIEFGVMAQLAQQDDMIKSSEQIFLALADSVC